MILLPLGNTTVLPGCRHLRNRRPLQTQHRRERRRKQRQCRRRSQDQNVRRRRRRREPGKLQPWNKQQEQRPERMATWHQPLLRKLCLDTTALALSRLELLREAGTAGQGTYPVTSGVWQNGILSLCGSILRAAGGLKGCWDGGGGRGTEKRERERESASKNTSFGSQIPWPGRVY